MPGRWLPRLLICGVLLGLAGAAGAAEPALDLTRAVILSPPGMSGPAAKAVRVLEEEVSRRSWVRWPQVPDWPDGARPVIVVGTAAALREVAGGHVPQLAVPARHPSPEGFRVWVEQDGPAPRVFVVGNDARGVLFGVGYLLRKLRVERERITLAVGLEVETAPQTPLRGHQLGYRPKANSYDGFTLPMWEQYIRELALFGTNAIELVPPRSDDAPDSPNFPQPPLETMIGMSRIADEYGLDVWVWQPALDGNYADAADVEWAVREWADVLGRLPRLDAVFVPSGDPGHAPPANLMALLEAQLHSLRRHHPQLQMWVSVQGWYGERLQTFLSFLRTEPEWLAGIVYGPQSRITLAELRAAVPARYPIRHYPDITHTWHAQYPVPDWDRAFALTLQREPINPRPLDQAVIFQYTAADAAHGFITYSEGVNDDVNKFVWSALGWDHGVEVEEVLRDYSRLFLGPAFADRFAEGLLALERNWRGPALNNDGIDSTLARFQQLEREATPQLRASWRFQQALYRAYYDAYTRRRFTYETELQRRATAQLARAPVIGSLPAMAEAERILDESTTRRTSPELRARIFELAEALFQSIRMQLSVERHFAISSDRGANLDFVDIALNDRGWMGAQFTAIRELAGEAERLQRICEIVHWTDPGPGGFYDDLGDPRNRPHLVAGRGFAADPGFFESIAPFVIPDPRLRMAWRVQAMTLYLHPLTLRYTGLDPSAAYRLRVVYGSFGSWDSAARLEVDGEELHSHHDRVFEPLEFDIPRASTADGELTLSWHREPELGGIGPGKQVAEVWLMRQPSATEALADSSASTPASFRRRCGTARSR